MAIIGQQLLTPEAGYRRYDSTNNIITYSSGWVSDTLASNYNNTRMYCGADGSYLEFNFTGSKFRILGGAPSGFYTTADKLYIDGQMQLFSNGHPIVTGESCNLLVDVSGLSEGEHTVRIVHSRSDGRDYLNIDAIDVSSTGSLKIYNTRHGVTKSDITSMEVGDIIPFRYVATSGLVGVISDLGSSNVSPIPVTGSANPNGTAYFIHAGYDHLGRMKLIADRNIQHNISWDTLNTEGIASGSGLPISVHEDPIYWDPKRSVLTNPPLLEQNMTTGLFNNYDNYIRASGDAKITGKHYFELTSLVTYGTQNNDGYFGVVPDTFQLTSSSPFQVYLSSYIVNAGSTVGVMLNLDDHTLSFIGDNGVVTNAFPSLPISTAFRAHISTTGSTIKIRANFGRSPFKHALPAGYTPYDTSNIILGNEIATIRLLSGGTSPTDKDNEWDKIIVENTLNGSIVGGDNNIWNWSTGYSWCSTTYNTYRVHRGYTSVDKYSYSGSDASGTGIGFRPVLLVETKESSYFLILKDNKAYSFSNNTLSEVTSDWNSLTNSEKQLLFTSKELPITSVLKDLINFKVLSFSSEPIISKLLITSTPFETSLPTGYSPSITAIPKNQFVYASGDIDLSSAQNIDWIHINNSIANSVTGNSILKYVFSVDKGITWKTYKDSAFVTILDTTNPDDGSVVGGRFVPSTSATSRLLLDGMAKTAFDSAPWNDITIALNNRLIRFATIFDLDQSTDNCFNDNLVYQYDGMSVWKQVANGIDYEVRYTSPSRLEVKFLTGGYKAKINY